MTQGAGEKPTARQVWWRRNRLPLLALLPLAVLAVAATSYQLTTLYLPNAYTKPQKAAGQVLNYQGRLTSGGKTYRQTVTLTLSSLTSRASAVAGLTLWDIKLQLAAPPDVPLAWCEISLLDTRGRLYSTQAAGLPSTDWKPNQCVPSRATGPMFDLKGNLLPVTGPARPDTWNITETVALPTGQTPNFVRVAWEPPNYALIAVP